jgi:beta-glucosidase
MLARMTTPAAPASGAAALAFPDGFLWGAATAAFQIEGSTTADGRRDSIWDVFARQPGAVLGGDTGDPACDHYRRHRDDVALMADLGLRAYRFSVAWPRVRPDGRTVNQAGLDFYRRLVDELLEAGIAPWLTLYHWDLPQVLEDEGGWTSRDTAFRFADYTETVVDALGDRVPTWTTLNEPWCSSLLGYAAGVHAPGRTDPRAAVAAVHHLHLAHGLGVQAVRAASSEVRVGVTHNLYEVVPDSGSPADVDAARRVDGLQNRLWLDPVLRGAYPADVVEDLAPFGFAEHVRDGDLELIGAPIDVLGLNMYSSHRIRAGEPTDGPTPNVGAEHAREVDRGLPRTAMGWEIDPSSLTRLLLRLQAEYPGTPVVITENGSAWEDEVSADGAVHDPDRVAYLDAHLRAVHAAIKGGADVRGYLAWSLMDNFEWAFGYSKRFGLVRVDYDTQRRTVKDSALYYRDVVAAGGLPAEPPVQGCGRQG